MAARLSITVQNAVAVGLLSAVGCQLSATGQNADGVRLHQQGDHQAAVARFQQALSNNPRNADAYYNLATIYHQVGRQRSDQGLLDEAEGLFHQCLDISPNHTDCHRALAALLVDTRRPDSAFTLLERWVERSPNLADAHIELARLHEEFGDDAVARRYLTQAVEVNPNSSRAWAALGHLREEQGRYAQALANYRQAYHLNRSQPGIATRIGSLQRNLARSNPLGPSTRTVQVPGNVRTPLQ